jgi:hypothetical protein
MAPAVSNGVASAVMLPESCTGGLRGGKGSGTEAFDEGEPRRGSGGFGAAACYLRAQSRGKYAPGNAPRARARAAYGSPI